RFYIAGWLREDLLNGHLHGRRNNRDHVLTGARVVAVRRNCLRRLRGDGSLADPSPLDGAFGRDREVVRPAPRLHRDTPATPGAARWRHRRRQPREPSHVWKRDWRR